MNFRELNGKTIREAFIQFDKENPHIYKAFEEQALLAIAKGKKKISAKLILNWIRWNEFLSASRDRFRINDAYQSYYARKFVALNPLHNEVFEFRKLRNEEEGPYMNVDKHGQIAFWHDKNHA